MERLWAACHRVYSRGNRPPLLYFDYRIRHEAMTDPILQLDPAVLPLHLGHDLRAAEPEDDALIRE